MMNMNLNDNYGLLRKVLIQKILLAVQQTGIHFEICCRRCTQHVVANNKCLYII